MDFSEILLHKKEIFSGSVNNEIIKNIYDLHIKVFGVEYRAGCRSCYADCFMKLYKYYKPRELTSDYELKAGAVVLTSLDGSRVLTNANMTNELAEYILKENKGLIMYFKKYPSDWTIRLGIDTIQSEIEEEKKPKKGKK